jgi:hypothetical protein
LLYFYKANEYQLIVTYLQLDWGSMRTSILYYSPIILCALNLIALPERLQPKLFQIFFREQLMLAKRYGSMVAIEFATAQTPDTSENNAGAMNQV